MKQKIADEQNRAIDKIIKYLPHAALLGFGTALVSQLLANLKRDYFEPTPQEEDEEIDIPPIEEFSKAQKPALAKEAFWPEEKWKAYGMLPWTVAALAGLKGGDWAADQFTNRLLHDRLEEERERFMKNVMKERLLASKLQEKGLFLPYSKSSNVKQAGILDIITNPYIFYSSVTAPLAYLAGTKYFGEINPEYTEYEEAREELRKRLLSYSPTVPADFEPAEEDKELIEQVRNWARERGIIPEE